MIPLITVSNPLSSITGLGFTIDTSIILRHSINLYKPSISVVLNNYPTYIHSISSFLIEVTQTGLVYDGNVSTSFGNTYKNTRK